MPMCQKNRTFIQFVLLSQIGEFYCAPNAAFNLFAAKACACLA